MFIVGFPPIRPTSWSCEKGKTKLTTRTSYKIVPSVVDIISTRPYYGGELFVGFLTNQANILLKPKFRALLGSDF